jgi:hypothetical protein
MTCPYCHVAITSDDEVTSCPTCKAAHHEECWTENAGCAIQLCESGPKLPYMAPPTEPPPPTGPRINIAFEEDEDAGAPSPSADAPAARRGRAITPGPRPPAAARAPQPRSRRPAILIGAGLAVTVAVIVALGASGDDTVTRPPPTASVPTQPEGTSGLARADRKTRALGKLAHEEQVKRDAVYKDCARRLREGLPSPASCGTPQVTTPPPPPPGQQQQQQTTPPPGPPGQPPPPPPDSRDLAPSDPISGI